MFKAVDSLETRVLSGVVHEMWVVPVSTAQAKQSDILLLLPFLHHVISYKRWIISYNATIN